MTVGRRTQAFLVDVPGARRAAALARTESWSVALRGYLVRRRSGGVAAMRSRPGALVGLGAGMCARHHRPLGPDAVGRREGRR